MNMRTVFSMGLMAAAINLCGSNLLKNGDFSQLNSIKLPAGWDVRKSGTAEAKLENQVLTMSANAPGSMVFIIQKNLPVQPGKEYVFSCDMTAAVDSEYMCYIEYRPAANAPLRSINTRNIKMPTGSEQFRLTFKLPEGASGSYIVLRVNKGVMSFKNAVLKELTSKLPAESLIKNGDFLRLTPAKLPLNWSCRGQGIKVAYADDGNILQLPAKTLVIQHNLPLVPGKRYNLKLQARSSDQANKLMIYFEWRLDGKLRSHILPLRNAPANWTDLQINFTFPNKAAKAYFVLRSLEGNVEFRNIVLTESK